MNQKNTSLTTKQAIIRYVLASASMLMLGLGFMWALVDKQGLFLHDRMLKTHFIRVS